VSRRSRWAARLRRVAAARRREFERRDASAVEQPAGHTPKSAIRFAPTALSVSEWRAKQRTRSEPNFNVSSVFSWSARRLLHVQREWSETVRRSLILQLIERLAIGRTHPTDPDAVGALEHGATRAS
jgi:hypothetical protein